MSCAHGSTMANVSDAQRLGAAIRRARERKGLSQEGLGDLVNRDQATVSKWESGEWEPTLPSLRRVAEACDVKVGFLLRRAPRRELVS